MNGANTVQSDDLGPGAQVKTPDVAANADNRADVTNERRPTVLKDQSGVDTCTHGSARFGELCVRVANQHHDYFAAGDLCEALELRLPSLGEAQSLARNHDLPNAAENEPIWTEEFDEDGTNFLAFTVTDGNSVARVSFVDRRGDRLRDDADQLREKTSRRAAGVAATRSSPLQRDDGQREPLRFIC